MIRVRRRMIALLIVGALALMPRPAHAPFDVPESPGGPLAPDGTGEQVDRMLVSLNQALFALSGNDMRAAHAQFDQFMLLWQGAKAELEARYPVQYRHLDLELRRSEIGLNRSFPEDIDAVRTMLRALRDVLLSIASEMDDVGVRR
jgi:hypothetical protein